MAPGNSHYYRLKLLISDGTERIFPPEAGAFFKIGESPYGVPNNQYALVFYDEGQRLIPYHEQKIHINLQGDAQQQSHGQLNLHLMNARGSAAGPATPAAEQRASELSRADASQRSESLPRDAQQDEADLELRRHLHAMDLEERQQEFIKNSAYVTEVGELFALNRIMRREMLELQRIIVQHSQQSYKDIHHVKGTVHELLALQQAVLEHAAKQLATPPAPPPDYVGLGHSALAVVKEIGVALIQRTPRAQNAELRPKIGSPQLTAPAAVMDASPAPQRPDVIERLMKKFQGMSEADVALAMSSPETWKTLFDELRSPPSSEKPAEPATSSKVE